MKKTAFTTAVFFIMVSFIGFLLFYSLDTTPFTIYNKKINIGLKAFMPQGWGFFTRDPQEEKVRFYKVLHNGELEEIDLSVSSSKNYFGLSRVSRRKNYELNRVLEQVPKKIWDSTLLERSQLILDEDSEPHKIELDKEGFHILSNQELLIYKYYIVPWEWSKITKIEKGRKAHISISFQ